MDEKKKSTDTRKPEIESENIPEIEHKTSHPQDEEFNLQNVNFASGENTYLNNSGQDQPNE
ncbi:hypothetical protein [Virgibacillus necropolis]|uniref:Uncharacterized protein n=1 Tax=Virgibacillus necropolis TaxID=163877 RepID=A0A221MA27_9BACI|nr:hypothetical protein [Virgibacillus necropolis]ASN04506.1 hypothetical protein CFK40_05515 [Virgibacillus necropolis]